jgi:hypothetical protein
MSAIFYTASLSVIGNDYFGHHLNKQRPESWDVSSWPRETEMKQQQVKNKMKEPKEPKSPR